MFNAVYDKLERFQYIYSLLRAFHYTLTNPFEGIYLTKLFHSHSPNKVSEFGNLPN